MLQFLNKIIYDIQLIQSEHQQQEFSKRHQDNLKFHLEKDLIHYLAPKQTYYQSYQDYYAMINSNMNTSNYFQHANQSFTFQQDNSYHQNGGDSHNQDNYHNNNYFQP